VICQELGVQQAEATGFKPCYQIYQCDLAGITLMREHAFSEKCACQPDTIETTDQIVVAPNFDSMAATHIKQFPVECADAVIYPGALATGLPCSAAINYTLKIVVDSNFDAPLPDRAGEAA